MRISCIALMAACAVALASAPALAAAPATQYLGPMTAAEKTNADNAIAFYYAAINDKDFDKAKAYIGNRYTNHNPGAADGPAGLQAFINFLKTNAPTTKSEVRKVWSSGDYVIMHVWSDRPAPRGRAIVDIYKMENGKVVEHWDVVQEIPEKPANSNTMF